MSNEKFYSKFTEKKNKKDSQKNKHGYSSKNIGKEKDSFVSAEKKQKQTDKNFSKTFTHNNFEQNSFKLISSQFEYKKLAPKEEEILNNFDKIIQDVRPLNSRQIQELPENIRSLSHQLTDQRSERRLGYMNENVQLSAYVRYYTWWNLVRITRLFANLSPDCFPKQDGTCIDIGSGPLTVITALWLSRPELRKLKLTWYCLDVSANSMALGEDIFLSIAAKTSENGESWKIIRVKGSFGTSIKEKSSFITCANMINEMDQSSEMPPEYQTKKYYEQLENYASKNAKFILIEPGIPKAARTLSLLRERFLKSGYKISSPCPHEQECPMNGFKAYTGSKNKWCNFAFNTENAPSKLLKLSELAKLPKERATLSFITAQYSTQKDENNNENELLCRINSDMFRLPSHKSGFYACSKLGLTLLSIKDEKTAASIKSGDLIQVKIKKPDLLEKDEKSGALIVQI